MNKLFSKSTPASPIPVEPLHPFYPLGLEVANYVANDRDMPTMLALFFGAWAVILGMTWVGASTFAPQRKRLDKLVLLWFTLSTQEPTVQVVREID